MTISQERLEDAYTLVTNLLTGQITPETAAILFEEDIVLFTVRTVEKEDPTWLLTQLADERYPFAGRMEVLNNLRDLHAIGYAILHPDRSNPGEADN